MNKVNMICYSALHVHMVPHVHFSLFFKQRVRKFCEMIYQNTDIYLQNFPDY